MITLKQLKNGKWKPSGPAMKWHSVMIEEDTPDKALSHAKAFLDEYELFLDHIYGCCEPAMCDTCNIEKKLNRETRGLKTSKRPKRYDA